MKRFSEQFKKQSDKTRLSSTERSDLRERVMAYMEYHPLPSEMRAPAKTPALVSQPYVGVPVNWFYVRGFAASFVLMMVVVVPVAAEYTAPGDMLYNVKVNFNEEVRSGLTMNPYQKIEWETERIERRISEARLLESEGKLTEVVEAQVAEAVKGHTNAAKAQIATLRLTDRDEAAIAEIAFATALSVQSEVLNKREAQAATAIALAPEVEATSASNRSVLASVVETATTEATAATAASVPSYGKLMARIEQETTAAFELFATVKTQASAAEMEDIDRRLKDIERKVQLANAPRPEVVSEPAGDEMIATMMMHTVDADSAITDAMPALDESVASTSEEEVATTSEEAVEASPITVEQKAINVGVSEAEAIEILRGVMSDLRKLISFMTDIDVRSSVSVNELVPITLTAEERMQNVQVVQAQVKAFTDSYAESTFAGAGSEKVNAGIAEVVRYQAAAEAAIAADELTTAETQNALAIALIEDLVPLMAALREKTPATSTATESEGTTATE